ncbi:SIMPL domain-containing protein [Chryseolinea lacunae]|uniref:SIMPL domain-containing protein n=1 Tax=Chryseolinea lacunae TaxID=2801331 RepID=A0ABS1KMB9_9BACT|nr:SIMPL domain-containing protein [Chryseolinea lacunae]MBL0740480.1 SIMPL domain-containing protein [Chryseolinea lacunae]
MKTITSLLLCLIAFTSLSQITTTPNQAAASAPGSRFIEVTGVGEINVDPNIIYLSIELKEYKKSGKIVSLEQLEDQLKKALQVVSIPVENLKVTASSGRQSALKKMNADLLISKRYMLKLTNIDLLNPLLGELANVEILSVAVTEVTHTEIEKYRTEAKVKAANNALEKATLLTSSLNGKLGPVLEISEMNFNDRLVLRGKIDYQPRFEDTSYYDSDKPQNDVAFEQVKISYTLIAKFRIE